MMTIGVDEAGRGPLAGPVFAAAVILPEGFDSSGIDDSKALARSQRASLRMRIESGTRWAVASASVEEIDRFNILQASMKAMERAVLALNEPGALVLVDGNRVPDALLDRGRAVIGGDALHACISAASILAKEHRDELMILEAEKYPEYGFADHFGYAAAKHLAALRKFGPCAIHRRTFAPISDMVNQPCLDLG